MEITKLLAGGGGGWGGETYFRRLGYLVYVDWLSVGRRGIILYLYMEYQSVCPFVRIGSPRPLSSHLEPGWQHSHSDDWRESLALGIL
jgi:hypothetical protein